MECYFCDKQLFDGKTTEFICICNKCLIVMEKSEARIIKNSCFLTNMIDELKKQ